MTWSVKTELEDHAALCAKAIANDIAERSMLGVAWEKIDLVKQAEIQAIWSGLVFEVMKSMTVMPVFEESK